MTIRNFVPTLWATEFLEQLYKAQVYVKCVNTDYEGEIKAFGDTVRVNTLGLPTISDYTPNSFSALLVPEVLTGAGESLTINQCKLFNFVIDDVDKAQVKGGVMAQAMKNTAYAMRDVTDIYLATVIQNGVATYMPVTPNGTASSATNPIPLGVGGGAGDAYELLVDMNTQLNKQNVPPNDRWVVVDPSFIGLLLKDPRYTSFATTAALMTTRDGSTLGGSTGDTGEGYGSLADTIKETMGFELMVSNNAPSTTNAGVTVRTVLAGYKGAVSYAQQIEENSPEAYRPQGGMGDAMKGLHLFGAKVFRPEAITGAYVSYV